MKICPNCNYENFSNPNFCEGCGQDLHLVRPEFFTIVNFIKKNSEVYAVFGILIALFQYFFTSQDSNVKIISLFPLFISGYLLLSLLIKADQIVDTQSFENSYNRYFNENSFEFWIFLSINLAFFVGLILSTGPNYYLPIFLLGIVTIFLIIFSRKITYITKTNHQELLTFSTRLNLLAISLGEISSYCISIIVKSNQTTNGSHNLYRYYNDSNHYFLLWDWNRYSQYGHQSIYAKYRNETNRGQSYSLFYRKNKDRSIKFCSNYFE